ncbi:MAG TPA: APC family permease [Nitrososphaerales archaeon]|nr:APC family permease [Nitrososphaerales archaeon]
MANSQSNDRKVFTREATGLVRQIGSFDAFIFNAFSTFPFAIVFTMIFAIGLFPSANIPAAIVISVLPALVIGLTYIILSISMPRSGGDYVWIGRILHPVLGFMMNFGLVFYLFTFIAVDVDLFTQAGLGSYFYSIGIAQNNSGALNLSGILSNAKNPEVFGIAIVLLALSTLVVAFGPKITMWVQRIAWILVVVVTIAFIYLGLTVTQSTFVSNFNSLSGTNVTSVLSAAASQPGYTTSITLIGTIFGIVFLFVGNLGYNFSTYLSGEVRGVKRTQTIGVLATIAVVALFGIFLVELFQNIFGFNLLHALSFLFDQINYGINPAAPYPSTLPPPYPIFFMGFLTTNSLLIFLITVGVGIVVLVNVIPYMFVVTRNMFAWSFDRAVPEALSKVDSRFNTPWVAVIITFVVSVFVTYITSYTGVASTFTYSTILVALLFLVVGVAAMVFPFRRKDIFDSSPGVVKAEIGGLPVISLLGLLTIISAGFVTYAILTPSYSGPFITDNFFAIIVVLVVPIIIYFITFYYYKSKGVPVEIAQREIPPE